MMNRKLAAVVAAVAMTIGLAACGGSNTTTDTTATDTTTQTSSTTSGATSSTDDTTMDQTVTEACVAMAGPLGEASKAIADSAQGAVDDPSKAVDAWTDLANAFDAIAAESHNAEVKEAVAAVSADVVAVRDAMSKVFVDNDLGAMSEYTTALEGMNKSLTALSTLCQG